MVEGATGTRWVTTREDDMDRAHEPESSKQPIMPLDGRLASTGTRWRFEQQRDETLFERAWFADFRERFRRDLAMHRGCERGVVYTSLGHAA